MYLRVLRRTLTANYVFKPTAEVTCPHFPLRLVRRRLNTALGPTMKEPGKTAWWLVLGLLPAGALVVVAYVAIPVYIAMYAPFTGTLPPETRFLFASYHWLSFMPALLVVVVWRLWPKRRVVAAATSGLVASSLALWFGWWAIYQPDIILALIVQSGGGS